MGTFLPLLKTGPTESSELYGGNGLQKSGNFGLGKTGNCQVAVSLHHVGAEGSAALNWRLYLPETWAGDPERRAEAGIPKEVDRKSVV